MLNSEARPQDGSGQNQVMVFQTIPRHRSEADADLGPLPMCTSDVTTPF